VKLQWCSVDGKLIAVADSLSVTPDDSLVISKKIALPAGAACLKLCFFDYKGTLSGILDSAVVPKPVGTTKKSSLFRVAPVSMVVCKNNRLQVEILSAGVFTTNIFSIHGKRITTFTDKAPYRKNIDLSDAASTMLLVRVEGSGVEENRIIFSPVER
jgi:hypothetical protein